MPNKTKAKSRKGTAAQYLIAGATGGVGRMVGKATAQAVSGAAGRVVGRYKKRRSGTGGTQGGGGRRKRNGAMEIQEPEKKLTGIVFWIMAGMAATKDIMDIFLNFTVIFAFLASLAGIVISFIILFYLIYNDVKWTTRKIITFVITFIIEFIPIVNAFIPAATINLFIIRKFENSDRFKEFMEKKAKLLSKI